MLTCLLAFGRKKSNVVINASVLQGRWKLTAVYSSNGSAGQWQAVPQKANYGYVQFSQGGKLSGTVYNNYNNYAVTDSVTLTFSTADTLEHYRYSLQNGTLTLSPSGPVFCTEGCVNKFVKVSN